MKTVTLNNVRYSGPLGNATYQPSADAYMPNELALEADGQISFLSENHEVLESPNGMGWIETDDTHYTLSQHIFPQVTVDLYLKQIVEDAHTDALEFNEVHDMMDRLDMRMSSLQVSLRHGVICDIRWDG